jgi:hypothetical protein
MMGLLCGIILWMADNAQFHIRMPQALRDTLHERAEATGVSMNTLMVQLLWSAAPPATCPMCCGAGVVPASVIEGHNEALALLATAEGTTTHGGTHEQQSAD